MIPVKPLDRAISNIKNLLRKYYVRMGLTPSHPKSEYVEIFPTPLLPRDPYLINEWLLGTFTSGGTKGHFDSIWFYQYVSIPCLMH